MSNDRPQPNLGSTSRTTNENVNTGGYEPNQQQQPQSADAALDALRGAMPQRAAFGLRGETTEKVMKVMEKIKQTSGKIAGGITIIPLCSNELGISGIIATSSNGSETAFVPMIFAGHSEQPMMETRVNDQNVIGGGYRLFNDQGLFSPRVIDYINQLVTSNIKGNVFSAGTMVIPRTVNIDSGSELEFFFDSAINAMHNMLRLRKGLPMTARVASVLANNQLQLNNKISITPGATIRSVGGMVYTADFEAVSEVTRALQGRQAMMEATGVDMSCVSGIVDVHYCPMQAARPPFRAFNPVIVLTNVATLMRRKSVGEDNIFTVLMGLASIIPIIVDDAWLKVYEHSATSQNHRWVNWA